MLTNIGIWLCVWFPDKLMDFTKSLLTNTAEFILNRLLLRKRSDGNLQSESNNVGKAKRNVDFEGTDEPIFGKKPRVEESITEDLR